MGIILPIACDGHKDQQKNCSSKLGLVTKTWQMFLKTSVGCLGGSVG